MITVWGPLTMSGALQIMGGIIVLFGLLGILDNLIPLRRDERRDRRRESGRCHGCEGQTEERT